MDFIFGYMLGALGIWQIVIALGIMSSFCVMVAIGNIIEFSYKTITRKETQPRESFSFSSDLGRCINDDYYFIQEVHAYIRGSRGVTTIASAVIFAIIGLTIWHSGGIGSVAIVSDWWKIVIGFIGFGVAWAIFKVSFNLGGLHEIIKEQIEKITDDELLANVRAYDAGETTASFIPTIKNAIITIGRVSNVIFDDITIKKMTKIADDVESAPKPSEIIERIVETIQGSKIRLGAYDRNMIISHILFWPFEAVYWIVGDAAIKIIKKIADGATKAVEWVSTHYAHWVYGDSLNSAQEKLKKNTQQ